MAKHIPREFVHQLLERIEIVDLIDGRVPLKKKSGNNYFACCPFHTEKSPSFSVSQKKQFFHCFGCGVHGNAIDFILQYDRLSFPETVELLAKQIGLELPTHSTQNQNKEKKQGSLYELLEQVAAFYQSQLKQCNKAIQYLKTRGLSGQIAKKFDLGYVPPNWDSLLPFFNKTPNAKQQLIDAGLLIKKENGGYYDRFRDRIMFPIRDRRGRIVGFGGRIIDQGEPKYLNSPETPIFQKGHELYGLHQALKHHRELNKIIIVEGYMDVIALFQQGIDYTVATLGTATTAHHLQKLYRHTAHIIFCFDGDSAGRNAAWRALKTALSAMKDGIQMHFLFLPENEDPDSFIRKNGKAAFENSIQEALPLSDFFFQTISKETNLDSTDGRARFVKLATELLATIPESVFKEMMFEELSKKARTTIDRIKLNHHSAPSRATTQKAKSPSALRLAFSLLIQNPELVNLLTEPLPEVKAEGYLLFKQVFDFIAQNSITTTAHLIECWREKPEINILTKLAKIDYPIPEEGIKKEFLGAIKQLRKLSNKQYIDHLLAKASLVDLTIDEKKHLHVLLYDKNSIP